ncbi:MAG TPA: dienelactone hydrolase family protein [Candidatus Hydrogenedentes bacterium]|nr:dienelactone hydrolase family protein [Candidatus Hydrogenedentota bacterium]HOS01994.1 dienelactone hydrolase family protein [Candidatus Hydrogenedentota bacterium]
MIPKTVDVIKMKNLSEWQSHRDEVQAAVLGALGTFPKQRAELALKTADELQRGGYVRRKVNYFVDEWERIAAWVFLPDGRDEVPAIVCCHGEIASGKDESAGIDGNPMLAFALRYVEMGYATIVPDCLTAGERISHGLAPFDTRNYYRESPKLSFLGKMLHDYMHAVDALSEMKRVDPARIGVIGHGFGAVNALLLAAFDERVQTCVASCGFTRFGDDKEPERWARDEGACLLPALREAIQDRAFPFDWEHVLALAAPSPTLVIGASNDAELSNGKSCEKAVKTAKKIYKFLGAEDALDCYLHHDGHAVTPGTLDAADEWFERWL